MRKLKFQRLHPKAILPSRGSNGACGLDIYSVEEVIIERWNRKAVPTGLAIAIPKGYYARIAPRSGLALKMGIDVLAGVIDTDYRGELLCLLVNLSDNDFKVSVGDRIAQLLIEKIALLDPEWEESLDTTSRGNLGFGSTGI